MDTFKDPQGNPLYFVVYLAPNGLVVVAADDEVEPIIAFSSGSKYDPADTNPFGALVSRDLPGRMAHVRAGRAAGQAPAQARTDPQAKWGVLLGTEPVMAGAGLGSLTYVDDERVARLTKSQWAQSGTLDGKACFNWYTPYNYPCGCVATAGAQLMYTHRYPTQSIPQKTYEIWVNGTKEPDHPLMGGIYEWNSMPDAVDSSTGDPERQAIGRLTHDVGVSVSMHYASGGSFAETLKLADAFKDPFGYVNAIKGENGGNDLTLYIPVMANPNLDCGFPVILAITGSPNPDHAVVCDGYGFTNYALYHHLNMGGGVGSNELWYNFPSIGSYTSVYGCVYNVFKTGRSDESEIISGRILDATDADHPPIPIEAAAVTASWGGGNSVTVTSNNKGIYALRVPSATTFTVSVAKSGLNFTSRTISTGTSTDNTTTCGNRWGEDFFKVPVADDHWQAGFNLNGASNLVYAVACTGTDVYVAGSFTAVGDKVVSYIAKWSAATSTWSALGAGVNSTVYALAADGSGNVYVGGYFTTAGGVSANYIAKWNPATSTWSALGAGMNSTVYALAVDGSGNVYAGGAFTTAGGLSAIRVAKWTSSASTWSALGTGVGDQVSAVAVDGSGNVYAGGYFSTAGGGNAKYIAKWSPATSTWFPLGTGMDGRVNALLVDGSGNVCAGGNFASAGGVSANYIAKWTPATSTWSALGTGMARTDGYSPLVSALALDGSGNVYAGGFFTKAGGVSANCIAKWTPATSAWSPLGTGMINKANALAVDGSGNVYAGGYFTAAGGVSANRVAKWTPATSTWSPLGTGMSGPIFALALDGSGNVYAGGDFATAGGVSASYIAKWSQATSTWSALGTGMNAWVCSLARDGSGNICAGGGFTTAGGVDAIRIAKWTPAASAWSALGAGMNEYVYALAVDTSGNLYAGGYFTMIGSLGANRIAKWTPATSTWSALTTGLNDQVSALAVDSSGNVYAGGPFTSTVGGGSANHIAKWTPATSTWSALGPGMDSDVNALAVDGSGNVYAGGDFATIGALSANYIAKWNPATSTWSALGTGMNSTVYALAVDGSGNVYAGGAFTTAGTVSANHIAKWTPTTSTWSALGSGTNGDVSALAVDSGVNVYAGGGFTTAGGKVSAYFAHFHNRPPVNTVPPAVTGTHLVGRTLTATTGTWSDPDNDNVASSYRWERAGDGAGGGAALIAGATNSTYALGSADDLRYVRGTVIGADGVSGIGLGSSSWKLVGGYEADVAPSACGGDATVSIADWVQLGRFAAALDTVNSGSEFLKADCAPRETNGDGAVSIADWVQAGRYAAALDDVQPIGGPTAPAP